jgi:arginine repressor
VRANKLQPHAAQICAWIDEGKNQQQIVLLLAEQGVTTNDSTLSRFVRSRLVIYPDGTDR